MEVAHSELEHSVSSLSLADPDAENDRRIAVLELVRSLADNKGHRDQCWRFQFPMASQQQMETGLAIGAVLSATEMMCSAFMLPIASREKVQLLFNKCDKNHNALLEPDETDRFFKSFLHVAQARPTWKRRWASAPWRCTRPH